MEIPLQVVINNGSLIAIEPGQLNNDIQSTATDSDFIETITLNDKEYTRDNIVIKQWNWHIAQAASCGKESGYSKVKKPKFNMDRLNLEFLDRAKEVLEKGEAKSREEKIIVVDEKKHMILVTKSGVRFPFAQDKKNSKKIIRFHNKSTKPLIIKINNEDSDTLQPGVKNSIYAMEVSNDFFIKKIKINDYSLKDGDEIIQKINSIIQGVLPGIFVILNSLMMRFLIIFQGLGAKSYFSQ